ncbi:MAG: hypothetical protein JJE21_00520 [Spirochaetaceae bacterium]|nr:hypothetical protein [Spirochaetaceae bacterium]
MGVGGGKILETAKSSAYYSKLPIVICTTTASLYAHCSSISVIYTMKGIL